MTKLQLQIILLFLLLVSAFSTSAQTPGFNYQALILNSSEIQIPGTDVSANKVPLGLEDITLRFSITDENGIEYVEEQNILTDENGMVSVIVGEGTPTTNSFSDVNWNGQLKYLNVELNIISDSNGFVFLDTQKILYIPHPSNGTSNISIIETTSNLAPPYAMGELIWVTNHGINEDPTLMIWNGEAWVPVSNDFDPTNELGLVVVRDNVIRKIVFPAPETGDQVWNQKCECIEVYDGFNWVHASKDNDATNELGLVVVADIAARTARFPMPLAGDQVWNATCKCIEVYNGTNWISIRTGNNTATNGLYKDGTMIKLGGLLIEPTEITTNAQNTFAIKNLVESTAEEDNVLISEKATGILRSRALSSIVQQEQVIITALDGQLQFNTPTSITMVSKIEVYRNGVRIDFTTINATTIELEPEAICYADDKIRIVQIK